MLISEFAKATGMTVDTIRFYIAKGLLTPQAGRKGGSRPYQMFSQVDVTTALMIKLQKSLGYSIREIAEINAGYRQQSASPQATITALKQQIAKLEEKQKNMHSVLLFLHDKLQWVESGMPEDYLHAERYFCQ
ncbi:MerR family transcriptional regulator [Raoultella ornithinolytica]|uniref:helix-turn-helix domain-containing protein n=1 Tax=Raoultella ornithinolytica TaxID=54291 RepID=UPI0022A84451|nr:MerR family transcriptional regulator [Raoultella ornithinolytica]MCZ0882709.1 MerR family transcriptional regulator [Raoultella ornithinolytica]MDV0603574.1 MerR family transcriptional regulator [Raoultella ornithinolytica]MDV1102124.1 MerR family transcriptional regulator [Raoultella ornithinolytica]HDH7838902.1 MerR family transcriptional regulator [Raoultella ornithinolytica]HDT6555348.1 MerR family transcriptional regulator [Raoultella ornithinolytica]